MLTTVDFTGTQAQSSDSTLLEIYLQQLLGQPFLRFRFSYGDELALHLGKAVKYSFPKLKQLTKGSYILGTRASNWYIKPNDVPIAVIGQRQTSALLKTQLKPLAGIDVEKSTLVKRGAKIICAKVFPIGNAARVMGNGLVIAFSDGSTFCVFPEGAAKTKSGGDVADWELFTPHARYLRVGQGGKWAYLPSRAADAAKPVNGRTRRRPN